MINEDTQMHVYIFNCSDIHVCRRLWIPKYTFTTYSVFMLFIYLYMPKIISEEKSVRAREREFSLRLSPRK